MVNWISVRSLLSIANIHELPIRSIYFVLSFTQSDIDVGAFIDLSLVMGVYGNMVECVLKLNNSLYVINQASADVFGPLKNGLLIRGYHQYQVDPCIFYKKYSVNLTYVEGCVIVSYKQDTITSLIESLKNSP